VKAQRCGVGVRARYVVLLVHHRGDEAPARLGVVASRRVGCAVVRNRGKRRVREWFRRVFTLPVGADIVVILRSGAPDLGYGDLCAELDEALRRALRKAARVGAKRPDA